MAQFPNSVCTQPNGDFTSGNKQFPVAMGTQVERKGWMGKAAESCCLSGLLLPGQSPTLVMHQNRNALLTVLEAGSSTISRSRCSDLCRLPLFYMTVPLVVSSQGKRHQGGPVPLQLFHPKYRVFLSYFC